jgi:hypothetical protein
MSRVITNAMFVGTARDVHGDIYDYSETLYVAAKVHVAVARTLTEG